VFFFPYTGAKIKWADDHSYSLDNLDDEETSASQSNVVISDRLLRGDDGRSAAGDSSSSNSSSSDSDSDSDATITNETEWDGEIDRKENGHALGGTGISTRDYPALSSTNSCSTRRLHPRNDEQPAEPAAASDQLLLLPLQVAKNTAVVTAPCSKEEIQTDVLGEGTANSFQTGAHPNVVGKECVDIGEENKIVPKRQDGAQVVLNKPEDCKGNDFSGCGVVKNNNNNTADDGTESFDLCDYSNVVPQLFSLSVGSESETYLLNYFSQRNQRSSIRVPSEDEFSDSQLSEILDEKNPGMQFFVFGILCGFSDHCAFLFRHKYVRLTM